MDNYYEILGVHQKATLNEIKQAYRTLSKKFHPDLNKQFGSDEIFMTIQEAYEVLGKEESRKEYDQEYNQYFNNKNNKEDESNNHEYDDNDYYYKDNYENGYSTSLTIKEKILDFFENLFDFPFIKTARVIVWILIFIFPIVSYLKTKDLTQLASFLVPIILLILLRQIILRIFNLLLLIAVIGFLIAGDNVTALKFLGALFVLDLVYFFLFGLEEIEIRIRY